MAGSGPSLCARGGDGGRGVMAELELFSPSARTALQFARAAAERMNHPSIGTEHLLLVVVYEREDLSRYLLCLLNVQL